MRPLLDLLFRFSATRPRAAIGLVLAVTLALGAGLPRLRTDFDIESIFPVDDPERAVYSRYRDAFGRDDATGLVAIADRTGDPRGIFTAEGLAAVDRLRREAESWPEVKAVRALTNARMPRAVGDAVEVRELIQQIPAPDDSAALDRIRDDFLREPLFLETLIARDGATAVTAIDLRDEAAGFAGRARVLARLEALVPEIEAGGRRQVVIHGVPLARARYVEVVQRDQRVLLPIAVALMTAFLYASFRRGRSVALALLILALSCAWVFGTLGWLGIPLNFLTTIAPVVIWIVGVTDLVHLLVEPGPMLATMRKVGVACFMTCFVAAVGFADLALMNVVVLREFGVACAAGMISTFLVEALVLPALLPGGGSAPDVPAVAHARASGAPASAPGAPPPSRLDPLLHRAAALVPRRGKPILAAAAVALAACATGLPLLRIEAHTYDYLDGSHPIIAAERFFERSLGAALPIAVWIDTGRPGGALTPEAVRATARIRDRLARTPHVHAPRALADYLALAYEVWADLPARGPLPETEAGLAQLLLIYEGAREHPVHRLLDFERRRTQVTARVADLPTPDLLATIADIQQFVAREIQYTFSNSHVTGMAYVAQRGNAGIARNLLAAFGVSFLVSLAAIALVFRSVSAGAVAMAPNLLPVVVVFGAMGALGVPLKATTAVVCSIAFGIAVDDTIHYLARCRDLVAEGRSHADAARGAIVEVGRGMILSTLVLSSGFAIFLLSEFEGNRLFGALTAATLGLAAGAEMLLTPALVALVRPRFAVARAPAPAERHVRVES